MSGETIDEALRRALAESKTPEGIAAMLERLTESRYTFEAMSPGAAAIVRGCAAQVRQLSADVALGVEMRSLALDIAICADYAAEHAPAGSHGRQVASNVINFVYRVRGGCSGSIDQESGLLQHPGESCPVHDAETGAPT